MAPVTRSSSTRAKETGGPLQARAKSEPQVLWFGGEANADQDLSIRLITNKVPNKVDDDHTLALLMVHSSRLEKSSTYFSALLSPRWESKRKRSPDEITLQVIGDVELYTDYFSRMYNPLEVGFKSVSYSLELLEVATHLAYDDLMSSICVYLASVCPWTYHEEMKIRKAVSSEAFPSGHAKDLLERLDGPLTRDDLCSLVKDWMMSLGSEEAGELLTYVLKTAGVQERGPMPTFEQDVATIIMQEFNLLHLEINTEVAKKGKVFIRKDNQQGLFSMLVALVNVFKIMRDTGSSEVNDVNSILELKRLKELWRLGMDQIIFI